MAWQSVRGHDRVVESLRNAAREGRFPHALLFVGPEGVGIGAVQVAPGYIALEADNKPARQVLKQLMVVEQKANSESSATHPYYDHWVVRCDGTGAPWCFIEVESRYTARCP